MYICYTQFDNWSNRDALHYLHRNGEQLIVLPAEILQNPRDIQQLSIYTIDRYDSHSLRQQVLERIRMKLNIYAYFNK